MIKLKSITIQRLEGSTSECREYSFTSFKDVESHLRGQQYTFPKEGYDKHRFLATWEDGQQYSGRYDARHPSSRFYQSNEIALGNQIKSYLNYCIKEGIQKEDAEKFLESYLID